MKQSATTAAPTDLPPARSYTVMQIAALDVSKRLTGPLKKAAHVVGLFEPKLRDKKPNPLHATTMSVMWSRTPHGLLILSAESDTGAKCELFASEYTRP